MGIFKRIPNAQGRGPDPMDPPRYASDDNYI